MHKCSQRKLEHPDSLKRPNFLSIPQQCYSTFNVELGKRLKESVVSHYVSCLTDHEISYLIYFILFCIVFLRRMESYP